MAHAAEPSPRQETDASTGADVIAAPDLVLTLPARAENVAVVRHAFGGLGDALDIEDQVLADVKLAVTEACTNVVVHAYSDGEGPMEVAAAIRDDRLSIAVRDEGRGMLPRPDSPASASACRSSPRSPSRSSWAAARTTRTEVRMTFRLDLEATSPCPNDRVRSQQRHDGGRNGPLLGPVLSRVIGMLAARAQCPIDRLDDALLVADTIAAHSPDYALDGGVRVDLAASEGVIELTGATCGRRARPTCCATPSCPASGTCSSAWPTRSRCARAARTPAATRSTSGWASARDAQRGRGAHAPGPRSAGAGGLLRRLLRAARLKREDDRVWLACGKRSRLGLWLPGEKEFGDEGGATSTTPSAPSRGPSMRSSGA
jgi:anti-sigma regulatory factor (Ser/Thr protein kinase)